MAGGSSFATFILLQIIIVNGIGQKICPSGTKNLNNGDAGSCNDDGSVGDTCQYTCNNGFGNDIDNYDETTEKYSAECIDSSSCTDTPCWYEVVCYAVKCPKSLRELGHGDSSEGCANTAYGDTCQYTCDDGYGNDIDDYNANTEKYSAVCGDGLNGGTTGAWADVSCDPTKCPKLSTTNIENGYSSCTKIDYNKQCQYSCNDGYGNNEDEYTATCTDNADGTTNGVWEALLCEEYNVLVPEQTTTIGVLGENKTITVQVKCDVDEFGSKCDSTTITVTPPEGSSQATETFSYSQCISYTMVDIKESDAGLYSFYASGSISSYTTKVTVSINAKPSNMKFNESEEVQHQHTRGTDESILCTADGIPSPTITWYNAFGLKVPTSDANVIQSDGSLLLNNAYFNDAGNYTCIASNTVGEDQECAEVDRRLTIFIDGSPVAISESTAPQLRENVEITCVFDASPNPSINWVENGNALSSGHDLVTISDISDNGAYTFTQSIILSSRLCKGLENINCEAENGITGSENSVYYKINQDPYTYFDEYYYSTAPETTLTYQKAIEYCGNSDGDVTIIASADIQDAICNLIKDIESSDYFINIVNNGYSNWDAQDNGNGNCTIIKGTDCTWKHVDCEESYSALCQIQASGLVPSIDLIPDKCDGSSLTIQWELSKEFKDYGYFVNVSNDNGVQEYIAGTSQTSLVLSNATPNSEYTVTVSSGVGFCRDYFPSRLSSTITGYTTPDEVDEASLNATCIVSWKYTSPYSWQIDYFEITYKQSVATGYEDEDPVYGVTKADKDALSIAIPTNPNSIYSATVTAVSCAGKSSAIKAEGDCQTGYEG